MKFTVDEEFSKLIPPLRAEEFEQLKENIIAEGCRDPLVIWGEEKLLLDGHNRLKICEENKVSYHVQYVSLQSREDALDWIDKNQLGRRNLTPEQVSLIRGRRYNRADKAQGKRTDLTSGQNVPKLTAAETLAEQHGVSERTIKRDGQFAAAVEQLKEVVPDIEERVTRGDITSKAGIVEAAKILKPHVSNNSGDNEWYTPAEYIDAARSVLGAIHLDPASSEAANEVVGAEVFYSADQNGLNHEWTGNVWMNPPYAQPLVSQFCEKLVTSYVSGTVSGAVVLVNNATETRWFQDMACVASGICFPKGRVRFWAPDKASASPLQGQAILYFGKDFDGFKEVFSVFGLVVEVCQ